MKTDIIMASGDPVALDRVSAEKLQELEQRMELWNFFLFEVADAKHINAASNLGVGTSNLDEIRIIEEAL